MNENNKLKNKKRGVEVEITLTPQDILDIHTLLREKVSLKRIARRYRVWPGHINYIRIRAQEKGLL